MKLFDETMLDKEVLQVAPGESTDDRPEAGSRGSYVRGYGSVATSCLKAGGPVTVNLPLFGSASGCRRAAIFTHYNLNAAILVTGVSGRFCGVKVLALTTSGFNASVNLIA